MANNNKPENGISVLLTYEYDKKGLEQMTRDIDSIPSRTRSGITKARAEFKTLLGVFDTLKTKVDSSSKAVEKAISKTASLASKAKNIESRYVAAGVAVQRARNTANARKSALDAYKSTLRGAGYTISRDNKVKLKNDVDDKKTSQLQTKIASSQNADLSLKEAKRRQEELKQAYISLEGQVTQSLHNIINEQHKYADAVNETNKKVYDIQVEKAEKERFKESERNRKEIQKSLNDYVAAQQKQAIAQQKQLEQEEQLRKAQRQQRLDFLAERVNKIKNAINKIDLQRLVAQIYMLRRAWKTLLQFTEASASWVENLNLLEVVFGDLNEQAKEFVDNASKNFGLDANALAQYVSTFKQMANAMGQATETGTKMAEALTYLSLDISSLRNVDLKTAASDLASGIAGQVKPVRKYGFDITQTSVDELLKEIGGGSSSTITQANKQLARTILLIRQSTDAWGDMAKTINTFANQQRVLNDQFETFKRLLGSALVGTFTLGDNFEEASKTAGIMTKALWTINGALIAINDIIATVIPQAESVNGGIAAGADEAIDSYEELDEAINGSLTSFDKFNTMTSGGNENDITDLLTQAFNKEYAEYMEKFQSAMKNINMYSREIADNMLGILFPKFKEWKKNNPEGLFSDWAKTTDEVKRKVGDLKSSFLGFFEIIVAIKSPLTAITLAVAKTAATNPKVFSMLVQAGKSLSDVMTRLLPIVVKLFEFIAPVAARLAQVSVRILELLNNNGLLIPSLFLLVKAILAVKALKFAGELKKWLDMFPEIGKGLASIANALGAKLSPLLKSMTLDINGLTLAWSALALVASYAIFNSLLSNLDESGKKTASWATAIVGALISVIAAVLALKSVLTAGAALPIALAGIGMAIAGVKGIFESNKFADGGFQKGGLFYAGEKGAEWVGRQGNTSTIVNDTQMSDIMTDSVALGVIKGNMAVRGSSQKQRPIVLNVNGKKFLEIVEEEASKNGKQLARVK